MTDTVPSLNFVTSFNVNSWDLYFKTFIESFEKFWPQEASLAVYYDGGELPDDLPESTRTTYLPLNKDHDWAEFQEKYGENTGRPAGYPQDKTEIRTWPPETFVQDNSYNYRMDAVRFSHKVFAITGEASRIIHNKRQEYAIAGRNPLEADMGYLVWIDADSRTRKPIPLDKLIEAVCHGDNIKPADVAYLGRESIDYYCTSLISFCLNTTLVQEFLEDFRGLYISGEVFGYREWTDAFVFTRLLTMYDHHGLNSYNLTPKCKSLEAFDESPIGRFMTHNKGNRKITGELPPDVSQEACQRYQLLPKMTAFYKVENMVEVGTWSGARAVKMASGSFQDGIDQFHYTGFDLFEDATEEDDKVESNVKQHFSKEEVEDFLYQFAQTAAKNGKKFTYCLIKGNTRETLKLLKDKDYCNTHNIKPTFAYIDGGHSIETIRSDYKALKHVPVVVFDDFYVADEHGKLGADLTKVGCNEIYNHDIKKAAKKAIINTNDRLYNDGYISFVVVLHENNLGFPPDLNPNRVPIKVQPVDCMPDPHIKNNIETNTKRIKKWINEKGAINGEHLLVVSGGPSVEKYIPHIKKMKKKYPNAPIMCVKHSLPLLLKHGIVPFGCTILDPRSIEGESTHGIVRKTLFDEIPKETIMFVASMTDTTVLDYIMTKTDNIVGFHAFSQAVREYDFLKNKMLITGGTCAATRTVGLFHVLGFRNFHLYGFDSSLTKKPKNHDELTEDGRPKFMNVGIGPNSEGKKFWTTGELLALAQDIEQMLETTAIDMNLDIHCEGLVNAVWEDRLSKGYKNREYAEILSDLYDSTDDEKEAA